MPPDATLRVHLLGRFNVVLPDGTRAGPWGRPTARRLVQLLSLHADHRLGREEAAELLFPDLSPAGSANGIAKALSMARTAIGPVGPGGVPAVMSDRTSIWIHESVELRSDLGEVLDALQTALAMPPGPARDAALTRATDTEAALLPEEPYASWANEARERLDELRRTALLEIARDRSAGNGAADARAVTSAWTAVAAHDATSEEAAIGLMRAYAAAGERDRAIRAYVQCVRALHEELDAGPSDELEQAYAELVTRERISAVDAAAGRPLPPRLFGRDRLRGAIRRRLAGTTAGHGAALLLIGPTGIGKTHLLAATVEELASAGWEVLGGRSVPDDRRAPYAALRQALASVVLDGDRRELLLAVLGLAGPTPDAGPEPSAQERVRVAEELSEVLDDRAAQRPLVLCLDDVQWADPALHGLLRRLAARPGPRRWSMLLAARSDEPGAPVPDLGSGVKEIEVPTLDGRATAAAVRAALRDDGTRALSGRVALAVERSRGNPFFAIELARASDGSDEPGAASVPEAIVGLLRQRMETLSPPARSMLSIAALAGGDASYDVVLGALARIGAGPGRSGPAPHLGLDELIGARVVIETGNRLALVHPLLRDAAVSMVNAVRRSAIHAAIAEQLEEAGGHGEGARSESAARHRLAAFEAARLRAAARAAAEAGFAAGRSARHAHAADAAIELLSGALGAYLALPRAERAELSAEACAAWLTIGNVHLDREDDAGAEAAYRRARKTATDDTDLARASSALAGIPYRHGDMTGALAAYRAGIASLRGDDPRARARLESDAAWVTARIGRDAEALEILERVAPILLDAPEPHLRCRTADRMGLVLGWVGRADEGLAWLDRGVAEALKHDDDRELMVLSLHRGEVLGRLARHDDALADLSRAARIAEAAHDRYVRAVTHGQAAHVHEGLGDVAAALAERDAELEILADVRNQRHIAIAQAHRARLLALASRPAQARAASSAARQAATLTGDDEFAAELTRELDELVTGGKDSGSVGS